MSYYINVSNDLTFDLPDELDTQERIKFCDELIEAYPMYFKNSESFSGANVHSYNHKVSNRLEIMANYILASVEKDDEYTLLTQYKTKRNKNTEVFFSDLEKYNENFE